MARKPHFDQWQSFADLGMGLMAVMLLIAVVLIRQKDVDAQRSAAEVEELRRFAADLLEALESSQDMVNRQEGVDEQVSEVFKETNGCLLEFDTETGTLKQRDGGRAAAELYDPGETRLSATAREQLASCKQAFVTLAECMSEEESIRPPRCKENALVDIEAFVLQGNTDRQSYGEANSIHGLRRHGLRMSEDAASFVENAELGAERARQALGYLVALIEQAKPDFESKTAPLQSFLSRARVESPSFGRYQAGPDDRREPKCPDEGECPEKCPDEGKCGAARNLSLNLRWRRESLRRPFEGVREKFCNEWRKPDSQLHKSLEDKKHQERASKLCGALD